MKPEGRANRRSPRISSENLVSYILLNRNNQPIRQGIGRTLNVSEGGILLETYSPIEGRNMLSLAIGLENDLMEFKGKTIYSKSLRDGRFELGIKFVDLDEKKLNFLKQYISMFANQ
ncbi:MAG: PilZ domain-containing protein [Deltaproteobacteria bacterium]|nr:PilZ domain-containing protein [Deltaproteobacteria bacterium]